MLLVMRFDCLVPLDLWPRGATYTSRGARGLRVYILQPLSRLEVPPIRQQRVGDYDAQPAAQLWSDSSDSLPPPPLPSHVS